MVVLFLIYYRIITLQRSCLHGHQGRAMSENEKCSAGNIGRRLDRASIENDIERALIGMYEDSFSTIPRAVADPAISFRAVLAWAQAVDLAELSDMALIGRTQQCLPWLEHCVNQLLAHTVEPIARRGDYSGARPSQSSYDPTAPNPTIDQRNPAQLCACGWIALYCRPKISLSVNCAGLRVGEEKAPFCPLSAVEATVCLAMLAIPSGLDGAGAVCLMDGKGGLLLVGSHRPTTHWLLILAQRGGLPRSITSAEAMQKSERRGGRGTDRRGGQSVYFNLRSGSFCVTILSR
jgi:hypothetical protein